jgi:DNA polymerase
VPKDLEGNKLTIGLSRVSRAKKTKGQLPEVTPEILARVVQYCRADVELMVKLYREHLAVWRDSDLEGLEAADRAVIDRGVCFDRELAETLLLADECLRDAALEAAGVTETAELGPIKLKARLLELGVCVDDCTADTLEDVLNGNTHKVLPENVPAVRALITARQALSSIAAGKLRAGLLRCSSDGRIRDNTRYYGAHTGRWSGSGMQLQNMAAGADIDVEATIELLNSGRLEAVYLEKA